MQARRLLQLLAVSLILTAVFVIQSLAGGTSAQGRGGRGSTAIQPGQECPAGTTETRPGMCQAPEFAPPSIVDYRPHSTLITAAHPVPKAKFPVVDFHGHPQGRLNSADSLAAMMVSLDALNVRVMISADNLSGTRLQQAVGTVKASPYADRVAVFAGIGFNAVGPGWADKAIAQLDADVKAGAVGVGEISKSLGIGARRGDGSRLHIDDPDLDPIWDACARLNLTVFIHTADPQEFFEPIDMHNERWLELSLFADRRYPPDRAPRFEELLAERDRMIKKHPKTRFVIAHLNWLGNDLQRLSTWLDDNPNASTEVGAVLYDLGRQPRAAHDFLVKYQDRVLFGKDAFEPNEYPYYWRVFETKDEYFDYYRNYHAFWKLYGLDLPDEVLKKLYYQNAVKLVPGLPKIPIGSS